MERGWKPNVEICPPCPRCGSSNTKFCYYNNYSMTQPRYFCKGCRRYWTKGGSLRNIPVGGGCRKTRRAKPIRVSGTVNSHNFLAQGGGRTISHSSGSYSGSGGGSSVPPTNIDLQQVYANFRSQKPLVTSHDHERLCDQVLHSEAIYPMVSLGFSSFPNMEMEFGGTNLESFLSQGNGMHEICGYNSIFGNQEEEQEKPDYFDTNGMNNYGLPPLPGEELGWSESNIGLPEHVLNPGIEAECHVPGGCSVKMFDLPGNSDAFSGLDRL